jgi:hypothetical protein
MKPMPANHKMIIAEVDGSVAAAEMLKFSGMNYPLSWSINVVGSLPNENCVAPCLNTAEANR